MYKQVALSRRKKIGRLSELEKLTEKTETEKMPIGNVMYVCEHVIKNSPTSKSVSWVG